jgi:PEP-CTERM motif
MQRSRAAAILLLSLTLAGYGLPVGATPFAGTLGISVGGLFTLPFLGAGSGTTNLTGGFLILVVLGTLSLNFVPEPSTLLLLGSGVAGFAALGRQRMGPR